MTLGGLALAVGILVDDATVTIENINFQLEQKKEIEAAIMDGARQIVIPATVSLLCISIVFVPMFSLGGVSGYLFRPMAKAVVFALIGSYLLSRTLVPTMANYLLGRARARSGRAAAHHFRAFPARIRASISRRRGTAMPAHARRRACAGGCFSSSAFLGFVAGVARPCPLPRPEFLSRRSRRFRSEAACARPDGLAHRGNRPTVHPRRGRDQRDRRARRSSPRSSTISACRSAASTWPTAIPARSAPPTPIF